jgi:hypothetical protein
MMKRNFGALAVLLFVCLIGTQVQATPVDLSTFTTDPGVAVNSGVVSFIEDINSAAIYLYNDTFLVANDASILSFDYALQLGPTDIDDYLVFNLNFTEVEQTFTTTVPGHFEIDLTPYRNQTISLAWGLIWGGDFSDEGTATAQVSNIDLAMPTAAVLEPSTLLLLGSGLAGLIGFSRSRKSQRS